MRAIFISYRRDDSEGEAGRLFDDLVTQFGEDAVFMDVTAITPGRDFRKAIDESVATCGVLLAIIDPADFVRLETASALKRDIPVVPVLIRGAKMPRPEQLPDELKDLAYRNGVELTHARWASDVQLLIRALRPLVPEFGTVAPAGTTDVPLHTDAPRSGGRPIDRGSPLDRQLEPTAGPSPARPSRTKWLVAAGLALAILAGGGYAYYSSTERERQATEQQRRAEEDAAKRRAEAERAELAEKSANLERAAAKLASDRAVADKAAADKAAAERIEADRRAAEAKSAGAPASGPRLPTPPVMFTARFLTASCTDLGSGRYRIETSGMATGGGDSRLYAGPQLPPNSGKTTDGKTTCSQWSGAVRNPAGVLSDRACKRDENEATRTDWKSSHVIEWRLSEPPSRAAAILYSEGVQKVAEQAALNCSR